jgi:hypothetical protein
MGGVIKEQLIRWTKTQQGSPAAMLDCGARAFDWRPQVEDGKLVMHHGEIMPLHHHHLPLRHLSRSYIATSVTVLSPIDLP